MQVNEINSGGTQGKKKLSIQLLRRAKVDINYIKMLSSETFVYLSNSASRVA